MGVAIAGIVAAIAAYIGSRQIQKTARENTDKTIAANKQMADYSYSKDLEMWNKQNEFNSPEAQQARLSKAGLNPNLVYGNGAVGNASSVMPKYQAPEQEYNYKPDLALSGVGESMPGMLAQFQDFAMRSAQIDSVKAQTRATDQNTINLGIREGILKSEESGAPAKYGLPELERERQQILNKLLRNSEPYQETIISERARSGGLLNQRMEQELGLGEKRGALMDEDVIMKRFQNEWMKSGATGHDNILLRMLIRQFPNLFSDMFGGKYNIQQGIDDFGYKMRMR